MTHDLILPEQTVPLVCRWFEKNGRSLPWRETSDPYRIWLSEIMLQQTRIEAVIPYYRRFLEAFPDPAALADAPDDRLMKLWEGLGYYSRAWNLKKAAQIVVRDYGGSLPPDAGLLRRLPGIGEYTAGAVASVAFGLPEPAVDGNVMRVLSRLAAVEEDVTLPAAKRIFSDALRRIYPMGREAALFTEGLMELGEVVCPPAGEPDCAVCPLRELCLARAAGEISRYPVRSPKKERRVEHLTVFLLRTGDGRTLLRRRPAEGLLGGLWEFPHLEGRIVLTGHTGQIPLCPSDQPAGEAAEPGEVLGWLLPGIEASAAADPVFLGEAKHLFTHVEWRMTGYEIPLAEASLPASADEIWAKPAEIRGELAVPTAFRAWVRKLR